MSDLQSLLAKGYFPRELPPPFNTDSFATLAFSTGNSWKQGTWMGMVSHNLARPGGLRRRLSIPNPIPYYGLAELIAKNWKLIKKITWRERLSASRPHLMKSSYRAVVPRYYFGELPRLRALRRRSSRYLLRTDINQFYPALYTHTIPWAIHTKKVCKRLLKTAKGNALFGNRIDKFLQFMNEGQTHGIPIGPDTSLVIAELLLAAVDAELIKRCNAAILGYRYVDDYELSFKNLRDGEAVLIELQNILADFQLTLNPKKTNLQELPIALQDSWSSELGSFQVRDATSPVGQRNDILAMFSRAFEIASSYPEESVIRYAIARVQKLNVATSAWRAFQNCVVGAASVDASAMPVALGALYQTALLGKHKVAKAPLEELFETTIQTHARRGHGSEVSWALWGAIAWQVPLSSTAAKAISAMEDDVVALLALDAESKGLFPAGSLGIQDWQTIASQPDSLDSQHWLLAYEAGIKNWLSVRAIKTQPVFNSMRVGGVSFYDPNRNFPHFPTAAKRNPGGSLSNFYA